VKLDELRRIIAAASTLESITDPRQMYDQLRLVGIDPNDFYQELEMSSRFVDTHQDITYSNTHLSLHSHDFYEILFCRACRDVEYLVGSERYRLQPGDIVFVPPGVSHRPILPETAGEPYVRDVLWINTEFFSLLANQFPIPEGEIMNSSCLIRTAGTGWEQIEDLFRLGIKESERKLPGWETVLIGNTILVLSYIRRAITQHTTQPMKAEKPELLDRVTAYIEENFHRHITLSELAKRFYVSESTISHTFKERFGVSVYHYVTQRRLIAAKSLMLEDNSLEDVARQVGFSDYSTFYRAFRQEYGISPRQLRKRQESAKADLAYYI